MTESPGESRATLLVVEDEDQIRDLIRSMLSTEKRIEILEAATGAQGLDTALSHVRKIDILLTDMLLPELSGYDLAIALRHKFPEMKVIMMTGYVEGDIVMRGMEELGASFLDKPFQAAELRRLVSEALPVRVVQAGQ